MKKVFAIILCCCMFSALLFSSYTNAATTNEIDRIKQQIVNTAKECLVRANKTNFDGYCGMYVNWQLVVLGINSAYISGNGNSAYDNYANKTQTTGGYGINSYPGATYSLSTALNNICSGGDAYNILVGFEKSPGDGGDKYGHALFIHAILNGSVYYSESSQVSTSGVTVLVQTISDFVSRHSSSKGYTLDGVIKFNSPDTTLSTSISTNAKIKMAYAVNIRKGPYAASEAVKKCAVGDTFNIGVYGRNKYGNVWYQILDGTYKGCYMFSGDATFLNYIDDVAISSSNPIPSSFTQGTSQTLSETITSRHNITSITGTIYSGSQVMYTSTVTPNKSGSFNIKSSAINNNLYFSRLSPGSYRYVLKATVTASLDTQKKDSENGQDVSSLPSATFTKEYSRTFTVVAATSTDTKAITAGSIYSLQNCASGKYLSVPSTINGSNNDVGGSGRVIISTKSGNSDQKIKFMTGDSGAWYLYPQALSSGRIIEAYRLNKQLIAGSRLALFYVNDESVTDGQFIVKWVAEGVCAILVKGNQTLAVAPKTAAAASTDNSDLYLETYTGASHQHWKIQNSTGGWVLGDHTHSYGGWLHNGSNHWKQCSCGEKTQTAAHTWNSGVVTTQPTESEPGVRTYTCTICPRTKTESIPATGYTLTVTSANSTMGTVSGGGTYQAGATATIKAIPNSGYEFVSWNDGNTSATRTITVNSSATYIASFQAVHTHSYGDWLSDANNHWKQCSCGEKTQKAAHTWNSGVVTTQPTESEPGVRTYTCTICPRTKTESIPATGYTLTVVSANSTMGTVSGGGTYQAGATATIKAIPNSGYEFVSWNDGNTNATRTITVNSNATYTASFKAQAAIEDAAKFTVANVTAQPGGYADVTVSVADNPGIASFVIGLKFDSSLLTPVSITPNSALISGITSNLNSGSTITDTVTAVYSDANGFNDDGVLYTIRFKVADTADSCTTPINLAIDEDGITGNGLIPTVLPFQSYQGSIKITSFLYGDCNLDGKINGLDSVLLARYLAKWSMELTSTQLLAMDVNADGKINGLDSVLLARYLAKWDVKLGPQ